jgi:hypothetical protein
MKTTLTLVQWTAIKEVLVAYRNEHNIGPGDFEWLVGVAMGDDQLVNMDQIISKIPGVLSL